MDNEEKRLKVTMESGEEVGLIVVRGKREFKWDWVRVFQKAFWSQVKEHSELTGNDYKVLLYLIGVSRYDNNVPGISRVAEELRMAQPNVSRACGNLAKAFFIIKWEGDYYLNPYLFWRGDYQGYEEACQRLCYKGSFTDELLTPHSFEDISKIYGDHNQTGMIPDNSGIDKEAYEQGVRRY